MIKRIIFICCFSFIFPVNCRCEHECDALVLIEADTRQVILKENEDARLPIASTTKIMTAVIAVEEGDLNDIYTVSKKAQDQEGSSIYLREGERISLRDLLYGLMLNSGNDAAVVIAEGIAGSCDKFACLMNEKAAEIGCKNTHFVNPNGLNEDGHYSSAYDMALIMAYGMQNEELCGIMATKRYNIKNENGITYLKNHNKLLWQYEYCTGGKTGYTKISGRCLVSCAEKGGVRLVGVTLGCSSDWDRHKEMFEYGFCKIKNIPVIKKDSIITTKKINGIKINLVAADDAVIPLLEGKKGGIVEEVRIDQVKGDIRIGDPIGHVQLYFGDYPITKIKIVSGQEVKKQPFYKFDFIKRLIGESFGKRKER